jgi:histidine ammonia-lyase
MDGPALMPGRLALAVRDAGNLVAAADVAGACTFAVAGSQSSAFSPRVAEVRPHEGDADSARVVRETLELETETEATVAQDPLSIRTIPQIHGTAREALADARSVAETELGGVGDNPLVFPDGVVLSCGGFNGQHVTATADALSRALVKVGHACERRVHLLVGGRGDSPPFVAADPGLQSGLVRAHYSAASLVREAGTLSAASDRNSVVSAGQEDVQSLGAIATDHLATTVEKIRAAVAVELLSAVEIHRIADVDFPGVAGEVVAALSEAITTDDRTKQIATVVDWDADGTLVGLLGPADISVAVRDAPDA